MEDQRPPDLDAQGNPIGGSKPPDLDAQGKPVSAPPVGGMLRSRTGQMYTPPTSEQVDQGPLAHFVGRLMSNVNPVNLVKGAVGTAQTFMKDPAEGAMSVAQGLASPITEAAKGNFPEALADAATMFAVGKGFPKGAAAETSIRGIPIEDLRAAGVGDQSLQLMRQGRPAQPAPSQGRLRSSNALAPPPPTMGNLALKPEMPPVEAPLATENAVASKPKLSAEQVAQMLRQEYGSEQAGRMLYGKSNPNVLRPAERQAAIKRLAPGESQLPNAAKRGIDQYLTNADPDAVKPPNQLATDYVAEKGRQGFRSESGYGRMDLLRMMGMPAEMAKYPVALHYGGMPWAGAMAGADFARLAIAHPEISGPALRAALLAQMAGRPAADGSQ